MLDGSRSVVAAPAPNMCVLLPETVAPSLSATFATKRPEERLSLSAAAEEPLLAEARLFGGVTCDLGTAGRGGAVAGTADRRDGTTAAASDCTDQVRLRLQVTGTGAARAPRPDAAGTPLRGGVRTADVRAADASAAGVEDDPAGFPSAPEGCPGAPVVELPPPGGFLTAALVDKSDADVEVADFFPGVLESEGCRCSGGGGVWLRAEAPATDGMVKLKCRDDLVRGCVSSSGEIQSASTVTGTCEPKKRLKLCHAINPISDAYLPMSLLSEPKWNNY